MNTDINSDILQQLQQLAQAYFCAIVEANTKDGKCKLRTGQYSAADFVAKDKLKRFGCVVLLPPNFDYRVELSAGTFSCNFKHSEVFSYLHRWETMCKAGKNKAVFVVGDAEVQSFKVITNEKDAHGSYKVKAMKMQHYVGGFWLSAKKGDRSDLYYLIDGTMFDTLVNRSLNDYYSDSTKQFYAKWSDEKIADLVRTRAGESYETSPYFAAVAKAANLLPESKQDEPTAEPIANGPQTATDNNNQRKRLKFPRQPPK